MPQFAPLWTDIFLYCLVLAVAAYALRVRRSAHLRSAWARVGHSPAAMCSAIVLGLFVLVGLLDSVHYRPRLAQQAGAAGPIYAPESRSALDALLAAAGIGAHERTYSAPLALRQFTKENEWVGGRVQRDYPRLRHAGRGLRADADHRADVLRRLALGAAAGAACALMLALTLTLTWGRWRRGGAGWRAAWVSWWRPGGHDGRPAPPWRAMWLTAAVLCLLVCMAVALGMDYHVLGTDRSGNDVLLQSLKSVRTALVIGTLTTITMLPPALVFGVSAGYFKGWVDDVIQYVYTTLTSIPGVLLVAACVLMMQVYIDNNSGLFPTVAMRADLRLFMLCLILGLTGWAGLCRLVRAETLKLRELEYVQAARAFGLSHWRIMRSHLLPNLMHIVLISMVLEFSGLVLYEAVLSYLGIGVDPSTPSFGTMIDAARLEMSRDPMIWWNLAAAFVFLLALVLSANLFADAVQEAFDPRMRSYRPRLPRFARRARAAAQARSGDGV
ncbi:ABC transporter permease [Candidimonas nitroreducens]|uniref:Peptide ABC transporter permease n=1 Tax=Candidimonas nitroreducens TaxID=683354 RepID=A0A225MI41_9BURK|nr:ABC transporter permease [Candidimonas nitroreducens]OWT60572.1 peptide ABC transporter permease [Candidimonas nitroreducens]